MSRARQPAYLVAVTSVAATTLTGTVGAILAATGDRTTPAEALAIGCVGAASTVAILLSVHHANRRLNR